MTNDLTAFLKARFDEDERVARADRGYSQEWHTEVARDDQHDGGRACVRSSQGDVITGDVDVERARHIAHYDPARMLREVAAKRQILDAHADIPGDGINFTRAEQDRAEETLRLLALPYADHDDYQEEWAP
ncbi:DUF6221 family protein [Streptosporangium saharense]|uniref:DUF6221 family protein n=1 Tax=Streptosporangium saharense TaxID=1706840 RepID=UPI00331C6E1F